MKTEIFLWDGYKKESGENVLSMLADYNLILNRSNTHNKQISESSEELHTYYDTPDKAILNKGGFIRFIKGNGGEQSPENVVEIKKDKASALTRINLKDAEPDLARIAKLVGVAQLSPVVQAVSKKNSIQLGYDNQYEPVNNQVKLKVAFVAENYIIKKIDDEPCNIRLPLIYLKPAQLSRANLSEDKQNEFNKINTCFRRFISNFTTTKLDYNASLYQKIMSQSSGDYKKQLQ